MQEPMEARHEPAALWSILADPAGYIAAARLSPPALHPAMAAVLVSFVQVLSLLVVRAPSPSFGMAALTAGFFVQLAGQVVGLLLVSIIVHFFADPGTGPSPGSAGWRLFGLALTSQLPFVLLLPVALIVRALGPAGAVLYAAAAAALAVWSLVLMILSVRQIYGVTLLRAAASLLAPGLLAAAGSVVLLCFLTLRVLLWIAP
jgi:hypothetical protein